MPSQLFLTPRQTSAASVTATQTGGWRLSIPAGLRGTYRLAQLDDCTSLPRYAFRWDPSLPSQNSRAVSLNLHARLSDINLPGTWGFGLWNDPFSVSFGLGGMARKLPALPNAVWFFHASPENHLALYDQYCEERRNNARSENNKEIVYRDSHQMQLSAKEHSCHAIPANGFFAGTIRSLCLSSFLLAPTLLGLPLLALRPVSRLLRRLTTRIIRQDGAAVSVDVTQWHEYSIRWLCETCVFEVDNREVLRTPLSPSGPLGLVLWLDNQFAAWRPDGGIQYGTLANPAAWLEIENLEVNASSAD